MWNTLRRCSSRASRASSAVSPRFHRLHHALANPAEFFCQLGLDIRAGSPFPITFPVELANDCVGYVPTEEALGPRGGGYETRLTSYSNLEPTAGRQMLEATLALAKQMTPGKTFEPAKAPPFQAPWSYGNVAPELK